MDEEDKEGDVEGEAEEEEPGQLAPAPGKRDDLPQLAVESTTVVEVSGEKRGREAERLPPKRILEAALFMSPRPMGLEELGRYIGVAAPGHVEALLKELAREYDANGAAMMIVSETEGWVMRLRGEYAKKVAPLAQESEISRGALKILGFLSQNEGIEQSKVADRLGSTVYDYVRELAEKGFITKEKRGRTSVLRTTQKFRDYFGG